jgi:DNA ligase D-like protein (predicted 3'-phosphoesterase)
MSLDDKLKTYRDKRDFERTTEPVGGAESAAQQPQFVVQKHDASRLHYDFRLEVGGVLKSWAVPKGPSLDPRQRRLAVQTEDHPLEYIDFEGTIPQGEYGGGTMLVWDTGTYHNLKPESMQDTWKKGQIEIALDGHKLHGIFALIRTGKGDDGNWLLIKKKDEHANAERDILADEPNSALTGRSLEDVAAGK